MDLSEQDILKILEKGGDFGKNEILAHEERVNFHAEVHNSISCVSEHRHTFLNFVAGQLTSDKFKKVASRFSAPIATNTLVESCFTELNKVYEGVNPTVYPMFTSPEAGKEFGAYFNLELGGLKQWAAESSGAMKTGINSIIIVDADPENGEPYYYFEPFEHVEQLKLKPRSLTELEYLIIQRSERYICFDDTSISTFKYDSSQITEFESTTHKVGYCPAAFFWTSPLNPKQKTLKKSPISASLSALDDYLFDIIGSKYLDGYAKYPILEVVESDCDYENAVNECSNGYLRNKNTKVEAVSNINGDLVDCPICAQNKYMGPGTIITKPLPVEGAPENKEGTKMIGADVPTLEYNQKSLREQKNDIYTQITGRNSGEALEKQAVNKDQVRAGFEAKNNVLKEVKRNLEKALKWTLETCAKWTYGDFVIGVSVSLGTEFYTLTAEEVRIRYKLAKENGASLAELDTLDVKVLETEYRDNPEKLKRLKLIRELEPYRHATLQELQGMAAADLEKIQLKLNLSDYVERFEREQGEITTFSSTTPQKQIENILKIFINYGKENNNA